MKTMLDVRKPIGYLFLIIGSILTIYAVVEPQLTTIRIVGDHPHDMILNLNLPCGVSMLVFASLMLVLAWRCKRQEHLENSRRASIDDTKVGLEELVRNVHFTGGL